MNKNKLWFKKMLSDAALAMVNEIIDNPKHRRHIEDKEMELIRKGIEIGLIKTKGNLFILKTDFSKKYDIFTLNREYFTQFATLVSLITEYKYPLKDCQFEYNLMDICVFKDKKPFIYIEAKITDYSANKLYKEINEKYSKDIDLFKNEPDRGNDALRKAKYIFKDKPKYFYLVTPKHKLAFDIKYTKKGFILNKIADIPFFESKKR